MFARMLAQEDLLQRLDLSAVRGIEVGSAPFPEALDPRLKSALASRGIAIEELRSAITSLSSVSPIGSIRTERQIYILETNKTSRDIEAPVAGKLVHKAAAGETYDVGTEIGEIV